MGYGSLQNLMMARGTKGMPQPKVGSGVTKVMWTDCQPFEVVRITDNKVYIKRCEVRRNPHPDCYGKVGEVVQDSPEIEIRKNKKGQWIGVTCNRMNGQVYRIEVDGQRGQWYYDTGF
jgi:hypothetical protein